MRGLLQRLRSPAMKGLAFVTAIAFCAAAGLSSSSITTTAGFMYRYTDPSSERSYSAKENPEVTEPLFTLDAPLIEMEVEQETEWLLQCQMPDGAIALTPAGETVVPYFANLAARTLVAGEPERARLYMEWYLDHLNKPDRYGFQGTIYDYKKSGGRWVPSYSYDSADSYAATFLSLTSEYLRETGDAEFVYSRIEDFESVARVLLALQDKDGLAVVKPRSRTKYLMDNCEVYRGLSDWASALSAMDRPDLAQTYSSAAERVRLGIENVLYSPERGQYAHTASWYGKRYPKSGRWYPDAVSQLYLVTEGVLSPEDPRSQALWLCFNADFPGWPSGDTPDRFPWARVALASSMMGDEGHASDFLEWVAEKYGQKSRPYPWYVLESATILGLYRELRPMDVAEAEPAAEDDLAGEPKEELGAVGEDGSLEDREGVSEDVGASGDTAGAPVDDSPEEGSADGVGSLADGSPAGADEHDDSAGDELTAAALGLDEYGQAAVLGMIPPEVAGPSGR